MINWKQVLRLIGKLLLCIETVMLAISMGVSLWSHDDIQPFLWPTIGTALLGVILIYLCRNAGDNMSRRDGYMVVSMVWIIFTLIGMVPFILSDSIPDVAGAFFESMSGFTSTGATVIPEVEAMPKGILMWRSMSQWIGGIGIIFFTVAILPAFGVGEVKLFAAEATGPLHDKIHPRISVAVKWIGSVYLGLTVLCFLCLLICGTGLFDALNISMATVATGGFSTTSQLFNNQAEEYIVTIFMLFSGMNYTLLFYTFLKGKFRKFFHDAELKCYLIIVFGCTLICTLVLMYKHMEPHLTNVPSFSAWLSNDGIYRLEESFRHSIFTITSMQTTTGFADCNYNAWPPVLVPFILLVMFAGACSGSSSAGFKCIRLAMLWQVLKGEFTQILHPRAVLPIKLNGGLIPNSTQRTLLAFITLFVASFLIGTCLLILSGQTTLNAFSVALSAISNVGPTVSKYGPTTSYADLTAMAKIVCSFLMLIGRLEIFPIFVLLTKGFWKKS